MQIVQIYKVLNTYISTYNSFKVLDIFVDSRGKVFFLVEKNISLRKKKKGIGLVYVNLEDKFLKNC